MNLIFRIGVNIVRKNMAKHDMKVKASLPKVNKVNKYLSLNYTNNDKDEFRKFNIYKPESENKNLPLIIDIHGGGWVYGDKDLNDEYAFYLASKGYNVVTFSYRLLTMTNLKGMVNDIFTFFNHIYKNKDLYKLSFGNVMISGDSAGGHLALLTLAINNSKKLQDIYEVKPFSFAVDFLVLEHPCAFINEIFLPNKGFNKLINKWYRDSFYKPSKKFKDIKENASLDEFIKYASYPPILTCSCTGDDLIPFYNRMIEVFNQNSINYESKVYNGLYHVFEILDYTLTQSREFNDYSLKRFNEIIAKKGEIN